MRSFARNFLDNDRYRVKQQIIAFPANFIPANSCPRYGRATAIKCNRHVHFFKSCAPQLPLSNFTDRVLPLASSIAYPVHFLLRLITYSQHRPERLVYPQSNLQDGYFSVGLEIGIATRDTPNILIESQSTLTVFHLVDL